MKWFWITTCLLLCAVQPALAQSFRKAVRNWQAHQNAEFADSASSPLTPEDRAHFTGLEFFPADKAFRVKARLIPVANPEPFDLPTSSGKTKVAEQYGTLVFTLHGQECRLNVYQLVKVRAIPGQERHLFLPFTDLTSGNLSYGGGRYIDLEIPEAGRDWLWLDFNQCYNPNCAYSTGWNCPIPPEENFLNLEVKAGVMAWKEGH